MPQIRILTWNAQGNENAAICLHGYIQQTNPDVVFIQERGSERPLEGEEGYTVYEGTEDSRCTLRTLIKNTWSVVETSFSTFTFSKRELQEFIITDAAGTAIAIANYHAVASGDAVQEIISYMEKSSMKDQANRLIAGDFNASPEEVNTALFGHTDILGKFNAVSTEEFTQKSGRELDYALLGETLLRGTAGLVTKEFVSDHLPVLITADY